jgi:tetratricopeptide (TPR) repeat protein
MIRKVLSLACFTILLAAESTCLLRRAAADLLRISGERAFFRNDHPAAYQRYQRAMSLGGDRETLEADTAELLLFGLDQEAVGIPIETALPSEEALATALDLLARRIRETPYRAYYWSMAADLYRYRGVLRRRQTPLDLARLSENPLENLLSEEWLAVAALETAGRLEPNNYIYHDLLAEFFLEIGALERAAAPCRSAIYAYPKVGEHRYLAQAGLSPVLLEASLEGFDEARKGGSMVPAGVIESEAGALLMMHGFKERAREYLLRAAELEPDLWEAHYPLGLIAHEMGEYEEAIARLREASRILPDSAAPHFHIGDSYLRLGNLPAAISEFRSGRKKEPRDPKFFYALGEALERAGQVGEAERQYVAAANLDPARTEGWSALLVFYLRHGNSRRAAEICGRLRALRPEDPPYKQECASLMPDLG